MRLYTRLTMIIRNTLGRPVVMGRKTWMSLPPRFRPLVGRRNIVLTRDPQWPTDGAERAGSITEALELAAKSSPDQQAAPPTTAWVIGDGEIYRAALEHATMLAGCSAAARSSSWTRVRAISAASFARACSG